MLKLIIDPASPIQVRSYTDHEMILQDVKCELAKTTELYRSNESSKIVLKFLCEHMP